jgi:prepilin-type N-terminal cleavage/methylation domain-containing protein
MSNEMKKNNRGFTLVELMQSIFLFALLAGVVAVVCAIVHFVLKFW